MDEIRTWNDLNKITAADIAEASDAELKELMDRLYKAMDMAYCNMLTEEQSKNVEALFWQVHNERDDRYRMENERPLAEMFVKYFKGKTWEEIKNNDELYERWGDYSDWHKDVYGFRPHGIVCGEYINPHMGR